MINRREAIDRLTQTVTGLAAMTAAGTSAQTKEDIVLGQSCQLTGPLAGISAEVRSGAALHFQDLNGRGGVGGRRVRVLALDDGYDAKRTAENARELIEREKVSALFQFAGTHTSLAAIPVAEAAGVPFIAPFTGADALRQRFSPWVFNLWASYGTELAAMVRHLATVGINRLAAVYLDNAFGTGGLAAAEESAKTHGMELLAKVALAVDGSNMATAVRAVSATAPQAVLVISAGAPSVAFVDAYQKAGHRTSFYMLSVTSTRGLFAALGSRVRGIVVSQVVPAPTNNSFPIARELQRLAGQRASTELTFNHMMGFIAAKATTEALKRAGPSISPTGIARALESLRNLDLGGYVIELSPTVHSSGRHVDLLILGPDGKFSR